MDKLRIYYNKNTGTVDWTYALRGPGNFPTTIRQDIKLLPGKLVTIREGIPIYLGGQVEDYACIEINDPNIIDQVLDSDDNRVEVDNLIVGSPRVKQKAPLPRNLAQEIDELKGRLTDLERTN